jgi:predicted  nucleic acid-binding Zn-ribbon protein
VELYFYINIPMEDQDIKNELIQMDARLTDMEEKMTSIDTKLTQVVDAILGNPLTKTGGFIEKINHLEQKIDKLEKNQQQYDDFKKRISWTVGVIISIALVIQYLTNLYLKAQ